MNKQLLLCFIWRLRPHVDVRQPNASANASALPLAAICHRPPPPSPARCSRPPSPPSSRCRLLPLLALAPVAVKLSRPAGGQERVRAAVRETQAKARYGADAQSRGDGGRAHGSHLVKCNLGVVCRATVCSGGVLQIADRQTGESARAPAALVYDLADKVRMRAVVATAAVAAASTIGLAEAQFAPTSSPDARCYHVRIRCHSTLAHCALGSGPERQPAPRSGAASPT